MINERCFCTSDGISITLFQEDMYEEETFSLSSVFIRRNCFSRVRSKSLLSLLLILCGDIETCPGPDTTMMHLTSQRGLHLFHQNIRGLLPHFSEVELFFGMYKNIDILTLSETHITSNCSTDNSALYEIPGYTFVKRNRTNGIHGGVAMYISESILWKRRVDLERNEIEGLVIEIFRKNAKNILVGSFYRPPDGSNYLHPNFTIMFDQRLTSFCETSLETIILGDLNVNYLNKKSHKN